MSDQTDSGHRPTTLSRRTFLRAAGVTGAAALSPAVLRRGAEAQPAQQIEQLFEHSPPTTHQSVGRNVASRLWRASHLH